MQAANHPPPASPATTAVRVTAAADRHARIREESASAAALSQVRLVSQMLAVPQIQRQQGLGASVHGMCFVRLV